MKIAIKAEKGPPFFLWVPNWMLFSKPCIRIALSSMEKEASINISPEAAVALGQALKKYKGLCLADIQSASGEKVKITL